jgi:hypothetical protein
MNQRDLKALKRFILSVLHEGADYSGLPELAAVVDDTSESYRSTIIYHPASLIDNLDLLEAAYNQGFKPHDIKVIFEKILKGYVSITKDPSSGPCHDAWAISISVGPGLGKLVYGAAYAMSSSGLIIPDRSIVSKSARKGWRTVAAGSRRRRRLDDKEHNHQIPGNDYHTEDLVDDCKVHTEFPYLNYAYESEGWEKGKLQELKKNHDIVMKYIRNLIVQGEFSSDIIMIFRLLFYQTTNKFFEIHFSKEENWEAPGEARL